MKMLSQNLEYHSQSKRAMDARLDSNGASPKISTSNTAFDRKWVTGSASHAEATPTETTSSIQDAQQPIYGGLPSRHPLENGTSQQNKPAPKRRQRR